MRAAFVLAIVVVLATGARSFVADGGDGGMVTGSGAALAFGFLLLVAIQTGHIFHALKLPHLTGYILCGVVFGPEVLGLITRAMIKDLTLIKKVAVALIALLAGLELNLMAMRARLKSVGWISVLYICCASALLYPLFYLVVLPRVPVTAGMTSLEQAAVALVCTNVLVALSPAVVIGVLTEERAKGPLSELCLSLVIIADLAIAITFSLTSTVVRSVFPQSAGAGGVNALLVHIFGSIAVGLGVGALLTLYIRRIGARIGLVVFATLFVTVESGSALHLDPLLLGLAVGLFIENVSPVSGHEVIQHLHPATMPTFAVFFAVIGAEVHLHAFFGVAVYGVAAALTRASGIYIGARLGARLAGVEPAVARLVPLGMFPQAGIALALAYLVKDNFKPWGEGVATLILGTIVVNELVGPVMFRMALDRAGEIGLKHEDTAAEHAPHAPHAPHAGPMADTLSDPGVLPPARAAQEGPG